jgi:SAM-dependent methyltransferase
MKKRRSLIVFFGVLACLYTEGWQTKRPDVIYVPTPYRVVEEMLRVADVRENDRIYDLGCGDGRIVISAAQRFGSRGVGVDIDPRRIAESRQNAVEAKVDHLVQFLEQDLFTTDFGDATVVTLYLLPILNLQLRPRLLTELKPGTRVISHDFGMSEWIPDRKTLVVIGERHHWIYCWIVPANVIGKWELSIVDFHDNSPFPMWLEQVYQYVVGTVRFGGSRKHLKNAQLSGENLLFELDFQDKRETFSLRFEGRVHGGIAEGTVTLTQGSQNRMSSWKALRDPTTTEPIDVVSFTRTLVDRIK